MEKIKYLLNLCPEDKKALIWDFDKNTATCCLCKKQYELVVEIDDMTEENRERARILAGWINVYADGGEIEYTYGGEWRRVNKNHVWDDRAKYRIYDATTPDSINWDHVSPEFKWMDRDEDGSVYVYKEEPVRTRYLWDSGSGCFESAMALSSYKQGTCDWEDSLVERPK